MIFLRHLEKSVKLKTYPCTIRHVKGRWGSGGFPFGFFVLKRSLWILFLGIFPCPQTMHKLLWNSKNVTNITKTLNVRENKINISWPDWEIHFGWENDVIHYLWGLVKSLAIRWEIINNKTKNLNHYSASTKQLGR